MKYLFLFILAYSFTNVFAQTNGTSTETEINNTLLENAAASQSLETTPTSIHILSNKGSSTTTSNRNLTDQEKQLSENYVDQGESNRIIEARCVGEMQQGCRGDEVDHKTMGMSPAMMRAATQAYATFGAMGDFMPVSKGSGKWFGGSKPTAQGTQGAQGAQGTPANADGAKKEKADDYCKYIPTATETIAKFNQSSSVQAMDQQINNGGETSQKETLLKAAKSHDTRAEQAQIQAVGWYGGAACYAYKAASGDFATDTSLVVKLGAAALLGTFYQAEVDANKEYARKTREIAEALPGKGKCNPITENECYCAEPEHKEDVRYCKSQIEARVAASGFTRVACTDSNLRIDPTCACNKTNTCFDRFLENKGAGEIQLGLGYGNSPFKPLVSLAHGRLEGGTLNSQAYAGTSAVAKKALSDLAGKVPSKNTPLTLAQKEIADAIMARGLPANIARIMAQNSPSQGALEAAKSKMGDIGSGYQVASLAPGKNNVLDFSGGNGLGLGGRKADKKSGVDDILSKLNPGAKGTTSNAKVLEFVQKAEARAPQITKSDRPIFEIISLRYQTSGRRLLQLDSSN